jgi:hypothetical protein
MIYTYQCSKKHVTEIEMSMKDDIPSRITCKRCSEMARRRWKDISVHTPENFKTSSDLYNNNTASDFSYLKNRFRHGTRPSGKERSVY